MIILKCILLAVLTWPLLFLFRILLIFLGWLMVPIALLFRAYDSYPTEKENVNDEYRIYYWTWKIMAPWQNHTDGFYCTNYFNYGFFFTSLIWSCLRNPTNGLRRLKYYSAMPDPKKIELIGSYSKDELYKYKQRTPHYWLIRQNIYVSFFWQFTIFKKLFRIWLGHKIDPRDLEGRYLTDYRSEGASFVTQFKPIRTE